MTHSSKGDFLLGGALGGTAAIGLVGGGLFSFAGGFLSGLVFSGLVNGQSKGLWGSRKSLVHVVGWLCVCLVLGMKAPAIIHHEGWHRHGARLGQRWAWEREASIHPQYLYPGQPQRYFLRFKEDLVVEDHARFAGVLRVGNVESKVSAVPLATRSAYLDIDSIEGEGERSFEPAVLEIERGRQREIFQLQLVPPTPNVLWLETDPAGSFAAGVSEATDALYILRQEGGVEEIAMGDGPSSLAVGPGGVVWVSHAFESILLQVDGIRGEVLRALRMPAPQTAVAVSFDGSRLAVALDTDPVQLLLVDLPSARVVKTVRLDSRVTQLLPGRTPAEWVFSQWSARRLVHGRLTEGEWEEKRQDLNRPARRMTLFAERGLVYWSSGGFAADSHDLLGNHQVEHHVAVWDLDQGAINQVIDLKGGIAGRPEVGWVSGLDPSGVWMNQKRVSVVGRGTKDLIFWDVDTPEKRSRIALGEGGLVAPSAGATLVDGSTWITDPVGRQFLHLTRSGSARTVVLSGAEWRDRGEMEFYRTTRAGVSCNSCHTGGGTDHVFYNIGSEIVLTPPLNGLYDSAPLMRQGPHNRISDLHQDLAEGVFGGYHDGPADVLALERFITQLPLNPNPQWLRDDPKAMQAGHRAFVKAQCAVCHPLPSFSRYSQHPEAWLFPDHEGSNPHRVLDVPILRTAWQKSAFLYDGRGSDLREVLDERSRGERHGRYDNLEAEERQLLLHFLRAL